jgi:hypothetical protein
MYSWFVGWIAYDIFVWNKPITQVNPTNFVGAITAMALIWAGTFLFKTSRGFIFKQLRRTKSFKLRVPRIRNGKLSKLLSSTLSPFAEPTRAQLEPQTQPEQPTITEQFEQPAQSVSMCIHHFGYLHQHGKTREIPEICLTCKELIRCLAAKKE